MSLKNKSSVYQILGVDFMNNPAFNYQSMLNQGPAFDNNPLGNRKIKFPICAFLLIGYILSMIAASIFSMVSNFIIQYYYGSVISFTGLLSMFGFSANFIGLLSLLFSLFVSAAYVAIVVSLFIKKNGLSVAIPCVIIMLTDLLMMFFNFVTLLQNVGRYAFVTFILNLFSNLNSLLIPIAMIGIVILAVQNSKLLHKKFADKLKSIIVIAVCVILILNLAIAAIFFLVQIFSLVELLLTGITFNIIYIVNFISSAIALISTIFKIAGLALLCVWLANPYAKMSLQINTANPANDGGIKFA